MGTELGETLLSDAGFVGRGPTWAGRFLFIHVDTDVMLRSTGLCWFAQSARQNRFSLLLQIPRRDVSEGSVRGEVQGLANAGGLGFREGHGSKGQQPWGTWPEKPLKV